MKQASARRIGILAVAAILTVFLIISIILASQGYEFASTAWSLLPPSLPLFWLSSPKKPIPRYSSAFW